MRARVACALISLLIGACGDDGAADVDAGPEVDAGAVRTRAVQVERV